MEMNFQHNGGVWQFSENPFPAYRAELVYGRNKRDRALLPVLGVIKPLPDSQGLPPAQFRIIKTKAKGTICIVPGDDRTSRVLAFITEYGGFRGNVSIVSKHTTCKIIADCWAASACESGCAVAVIMAPGEQIVFHSTGRRQDDYILFTWQDGEVKRTVYTSDEWTAVHEDFTDAEEL